MWWVALLAVVYLAALCALVWVSGRNRGLYAAAKGLCSALFILTAAAAWLRGARQSPGFFALLMCGLLLCGFGDVFLGLANRYAARVSKKPFLAGAAAFMLAHGFFCALFCGAAPFRWYDLALPAALPAVLVLAEKRGAVRLKSLRPLACAYSFLMGLTAVKALQAGGLFAGGGALLFFLSDAVLLFLYFGAVRPKALRTVNLCVYYAGMFLLALFAGSL